MQETDLVIRDLRPRQRGKNLLSTITYFVTLSVGCEHFLVLMVTLATHEHGQAGYRIFPSQSTKNSPALLFFLFLFSRGPLPPRRTI